MRPTGQFLVDIVTVQYCPLRPVCWFATIIFLSGFQLNFSLNESPVFVDKLPYSHPKHNTFEPCSGEKRSPCKARSTRRTSLFVTPRDSGKSSNDEKRSIASAYVFEVLGFEVLGLSLRDTTEYGYKSGGNVSTRALPRLSRSHPGHPVQKKVVFRKKIFRFGTNYFVFKDTVLFSDIVFCFRTKYCVFK